MNRSPVHMVRKGAGQLYALMLPLARRILPHVLRRRLYVVVPLMERLLSPSTRSAFLRREMRLADLAPVLPAKRFDGRVILANNALTWGGVERQVVYTLTGLAQRMAPCPGLLCLRLGLGESYDFYKGALHGFPGPVRNVMAIEEARRILASMLRPDQAEAVQKCIGWMPQDAQQEVLRYLADFLQIRPAVVHAWQDGLSITAGYAARIAGVPRIIVAGRNVAPISFAYHRAHMSFAYHELASCPDVVFLNNSEAGIRSYAGWLGLPESRFVLLRNGIDPSAIRRPQPAETRRLRERLGIPPGVPVVGSIFRFYPEKRPLLWVDAALAIARRHPEAHFVVFGTGPLVQAAVRRAKRRGLEGRLHLPGTMADTGLALSLFDAFLLVSGFEGTPNVVLEASLLGIPVVVTDSGGSGETVQHGVTGVVVKGSRAEDLAEPVSRALMDPGVADRARTAGPAFVLERFGLARMVAETERLYRAGSSTSQD